MDKKELKALRRPFLKELFRKNKFSFALTLLASLLSAASSLMISWTLKGVSDLISGDGSIGFWTLLLVAGVGIALLILAWVLDRTF
ncbi:MAG: hypothetical protein II049_00345, partial [Clostridia bacterium]|nr:hypothetical protein [Clostridia bacterium]